MPTTAGAKQRQHSRTLIESFPWLALDNDLLVTWEGGGWSRRLSQESAPEEELLGGTGLENAAKSLQARLVQLCPHS